MWITSGQILDNFWTKKFQKIQKNAKKFKNSRKNPKKRKKARKNPENTKKPVRPPWGGLNKVFGQ